MLLSERFAIRRDQLTLLCREALSKGGDYCDLFFENSTIWNLLLRDGEVSSGGYHRDYGCGIRVLSGEKTGYAYSESTDMTSLLKAAKAASIICDGKGSKEGYKGVDISCGNGFYPMVKDLRESELASFTPLLQSLDRKIHALDSRVDKVVASLSYSLSEIMMYNSLDELTEDIRPLCSLNVTAVFRNGDSFQTKSASKSLRMGAEFYSEALVDELARKVCSGVDEMFEARRPKGGQMNVVMAAGASGILLHEAMGHAFEADFNRKGQSIFSDRMGRRICRRGINIVDDATLSYYRGSLNYDDEGVPGQKTYMVTDGVLTSFLHDRISAKYFGVPSTGNGRRESFRYNPIPRMRSTYMESGNDGSVEDLIRMAGNGIYVDEFANGEVKIGEGDFTFYVKSGFLIENGRLTMPVKDINIIGNGPQALASIEAVASDLKVDDGRWTCGKGQSAPVSCGIPSVLIKDLTVGGGL
jgi:TldD protein